MGIKIVVGYGFGDETKGATVDYLAEKDNASLVVRFNGGAQAAHNVVTPDGAHHTFSMFGSGTFVGAKTHLSRFVRVDPYVIWEESHDLYQKGVNRPTDLLSVDENCIITTPFHIAHSRYMAPHHRRGTCGMGVGVSKAYANAFRRNALYAGDLHDRQLTLAKLKLMSSHYKPAVEQTDIIKDVDSELEQMADFYLEFADSVAITNESDWQEMAVKHENIICEGAQGVLLDSHFGFIPYVTSSRTTRQHAMTLFHKSQRTDIKVIGVLRSYMTRHGVGHFPSETPVVGMYTTEKHNSSSGLQGAFREGWLDAMMIHHAMKYGGRPDVWAVSHLDCIKPHTWAVYPEREDTSAPPPPSMTMGIGNEYKLVQWLHETSQVPVAYISHGETRKDRSAI